MAIKSLTLGEIIYLKCAAENSPSSCHLANLRDGSEPPRPTRCSFKHFSKLMSIWNSTNSSLKWKAVVKRAISLTLGNNTYVYIWNSFWHAGVAEVLENVTNNRCSRTETDAKMRIISAKRRAEIYVGGEHILPAEHLLLWQRTLPASQRASDEETQTDHTPTWCKFSPPRGELCGLLSLTDHYPSCSATVFQTSAYMSVMEYVSFSTANSCPHTSRTTAS